MKWIGLTGGIASGKSTVTKFLRTLGFEVLDADQISHELTQIQGPALDEIFRTFGIGVRNLDGSLNRDQLGQLVFGRADQLKKLELILHPLVREKIAAEKARLFKVGKSAVFYDVPLLYEKAIEKDFDAVIVVYCSREQQLTRLMDRNALSAEQAEARLASQLPLEDKKKRAHHVVNNTRDHLFLESEILRVLAELNLKSKT